MPEIERCVGSFFPPFQGLTFLPLGSCPKSTQSDELLRQGLSNYRALLACHRELVQNSCNVKRDMLKLILGIVDFEVKDLDTVVVRLGNMHDQLE